MASPLQNVSPNGYNGYELMSALQKFIRRGMEKEALWVFFESEATGLYSIMKNRLLTIVYEDIGVANEPLLNSISSHIFRADEFYKAKNGGWRLVITNIIIMACRGQKTRMADDMIAYVLAEKSLGWVVDFQDYEEFIYDCHTLQGKRKGRGTEHFWNHSAKLDTPNETTDYNDIAQESWYKAEKIHSDVFAESYKKQVGIQERLL